MMTSLANGTAITTGMSFNELLAVVRPDFSSTTWEAFQRFGVEGVPARRVAEELGLSENAVILAKSRVLKRLREEAGDLLW